MSNWIEEVPRFFRVPHPFENDLMSPVTLVPDRRRKRLLYPTRTPLGGRPRQKTISRRVSTTASEPCRVGRHTKTFP